MATRFSHSAARPPVTAVSPNGILGGCARCLGDQPPPGSSLGDGSSHPPVDRTDLSRGSLVIRAFFPRACSVRPYGRVGLGTSRSGAAAIRSRRTGRFGTHWPQALTFLGVTVGESILVLGYPTGFDALLARAAQHVSSDIMKRAARRRSLKYKLWQNTN